MTFPQIGKILCVQKSRKFALKCDNLDLGLDIYYLALNLTDLQKVNHLAVINIDSLEQLTARDNLYLFTCQCAVTEIDTNTNQSARKRARIYIKSTQRKGRMFSMKSLSTHVENSCSYVTQINRSLKLSSRASHIK
jgi:hypothetical protein